MCKHAHSHVAGLHLTSDTYAVQHLYDPAAGQTGEISDW